MGKPAADHLADAEAWRKQRVRMHWKPCSTCQLPQVKTINALKARGWTAGELVDYLVEECGLSPDDVTTNKLNHHFAGKHPQRRPNQ